MKGKLWHGMQQPFCVYLSTVPLGTFSSFPSPALPHSAASSLTLPPPASFPYISVSFHHIPPCIPCSQSCPSVLCFLCLDSPPCSLLCMHYSSSLAVLCKTVLLTHSPLPSFPPYSSTLELFNFSVEFACHACFSLHAAWDSKDVLSAVTNYCIKLQCYMKRTATLMVLQPDGRDMLGRRKLKKRKVGADILRSESKDTRLKGFLIKCFATRHFLRSSLDSQSLLL